MTALKLVNNTGLKSEKNLCYVNTELQLLYSTPDARNLFSSKAYRGNFQGNLPICDELSTNCWEEVFEDQPVPPGLHV